ncbi:unnamed protein product, partial [Brassica rapa subsp. trilocularis]
MGFPTGIKELEIPEYIFNILYVIGFFRDMINALCPYIGLPHFLDDGIPRPGPIVPDNTAMTLAYEVSPVVRFSDLQTDLEDCCTFCLFDFAYDDKVRQLPNCRHVFHKRCMDRRIVDCRKITCPICRDRFLPAEYYARINSGFGSVWYIEESEKTNKDTNRYLSNLKKQIRK